MSCACRTKPLGIFVKSLTELRIADPVVARHARRSCVGSPVAFRWAPTHHPARLFSSEPVAYFPRREWRNSHDTPSVGKAEEKRSHASTDVAADTIASDSPTLTESTSSSDLIAAKQNGTILDYNPESLDALISSLDEMSITGQETTLETDHKAGLAVPSKSRPRRKPPIGSSQLEWRKVAGGGGRREPSAEKVRPAEREDWQIQKKALKEKFPEGWQPRKRLSPDALDGIRALHAQFPEQYTTEALAKHFEVSAEAIRRILKSKWTPSPDEETRRQERWFNRGKNIWGPDGGTGNEAASTMAQPGSRPETPLEQEKGPPD
ncbi:hypothetical protein NUW58_g9562 [Xylaria curta]|uniref:Uncharacterized protein n=1 Tax=Xylaria curta TaxID=42375 RepID=A0ACC1MW60_9PEZI|nr:hypothetical protein NUW58_g9562 [Xylaria curta]